MYIYVYLCIYIYFLEIILHRIVTPKFSSPSFFRCDYSSSRLCVPAPRNELSAAIFGLQILQGRVCTPRCCSELAKTKGFVSWRSPLACGEPWAWNGDGWRSLGLLLGRGRDGGQRGKKKCSCASAGRFLHCLRICCPGAAVGSLRWSSGIFSLKKRFLLSQPAFSLQNPLNPFSFPAFAWPVQRGRLPVPRFADCSELSAHLRAAELCKNLPLLKSAGSRTFSGQLWLLQGGSGACSLELLGLGPSVPRGWTRW